MNKIDSFSGKYEFLSNFYCGKCYVLYEGIAYTSSEHAFQAAKTTDENDRWRIANLLTPGQAKNAGRKVSLRKDWNNIRLQVMEDIVRSKFSFPGLKQMLMETQDAELIEGNTWGDTFWGVCNGVGENNLGKILMKIRDEIKSQNANETNE